MDADLHALLHTQQMPYGAARTEAVAALLKKIDEDNNTEVEAYALMAMVEAYFFDRGFTKALVPFARVRRLWEEHPERFDEHDQGIFFSVMNWMLGGMIDNPSIPSTTVLPLLDDLDALVAARGEYASVSAYERLRWAQRSESDPEAIERAVQNWRTAPANPHECDWCNISRIAMVRLRQHRFEDVLELAAARGEEPKNCWMDPADLYSLIALAEFETGDSVTAVDTYRKFELKSRGIDTPLILARARMVSLLGRGGALDRTIASIQRDEELLHAAMTHAQQLDVLMRTAAATTALAETYGHADAPIALRITPATTIAELAAWSTDAALALADQFDARAGTTTSHERVLSVIHRPAMSPPLDFSIRFQTTADQTAELDAATERHAMPVEEANDALSAWQQALDEAEAATDPMERAQALHRAATLAEADGALADAGFAYAELAYQLADMQDSDGAHEAFERAHARLQAGGVDAQLIIPVLMAWAPTAFEQGAGTQLLAALEAARDVVSLQQAATEDERLAARQLEQRTNALAQADDTIARILASDVLPARRNEAAAIAERAAQSFESSLAMRDAVDAWQLTAQILTEDGDRIGTAAALQKAFTVSHGTKHPARQQIASDLIAALTDLGDTEGAARVRDDLGIA